MNFIVVFSSWAPVLAWAGLIYFLSSIPHLNSGLEWDHFLRKGAHVCEYAVFTFFLLRALRGTCAQWTWTRVAAGAGTIAVLYACSDEFHQSFVPGRGASPVDVLIDSVGVALAILFCRWTKLYE